MGDVDELLVLIDKQQLGSSSNNDNDDDDDAEIIEQVDEREGMVGAYKQMLKYCMHEVDEIVKCHKKNDTKITTTTDDGNNNNEEEVVVLRLGKSAMHKTAKIGNAIHLLGASLGGYGFYTEEVEYYNEALRIKTLSVNGNIGTSVSISDTLHSMGFALDNMGGDNNDGSSSVEEALECYDRALDIRYEVLGEDDLRVAETLHNKVCMQV